MEMSANRRRGRRSLRLLAATTVAGLLASSFLALSGISAGAAPARTAERPPKASASPEPQIKTTSLPLAQRTAPYSATLKEVGGSGHYRWRTTGTLPQGLKLRPEGTIVGTPTLKAVTETFAVVVTDVGHPRYSMSAVFTIAVSSGSTPMAITNSRFLHACPAPSRVLCGTVRVPLYWSSPNGPKLTVRFRVYPHMDQSLPPLEPIVAMEGGPGLPSIGSAASYLLMIGSLVQRHDLIVMDNRGTGISSVLKCPVLQHYFDFAEPGDLAHVVAGCQDQLGAAANAYGTDAVGDDLAYILGKLGIKTVDMYGDSYGDFSAQVFTLHHPSLVRTLVLDGSYNNEYNPFEMEDTAAMRRAWTLLCDHSDSCSGKTILKQIAAFALRLQDHPIKGVAANYSGRFIPVDLTAAAFAQLVYDATYTYTEFRDLPGALQAYAAGDKTPLMRLAAEDVEQNTSGSPKGSSVGDFEAVSCHDYPTVWQTSASNAVRRAQTAAAIATLKPNVFAPFTKATYLASYDENSLVFGCLDWKAPTTSDPPFPNNIPYPHTPVLIFDGQFDQATPIFDTRKVIRSWPNVTFVEVSNSNHVTADYDFQNCTSAILQRFIQTLSPGDTTCATNMPPVPVVADFPTDIAAAPTAQASGDATNTLIGRQAAWTTAQTIGDALTRWFNLSYGNGFGLYGGAFKAHGVFFASGPITLSLHDCRFVKDLAVSGPVIWNRTTGVVTATLKVQGPGPMKGSFGVHWLTGVSDWKTPATVSGTFDGQTVSVDLSAPWVPQS
jgi:pimeloyl-ACP methyl ester carboxylesterase